MTHDDGGGGAAWTGALAVPPDERQPRVAMRGALERLTPLLEVMHRPVLLTASWSERDGDDRERAGHAAEPLVVDGWRDVLERLDELAGRAPVVMISSLVVTMATRLVAADAELWRPAAAELRLGASSPAASELAVSYRSFVAPVDGRDREALAAVVDALASLGARR
jgi:hypothetical protein